ncbi:MAG TPA: hypothetical protein VNU48_11540, partial [Burkholderiaceae bacterium]|nr:hypothetical protein [Burkholderiaceae bacterium]
MDYLTRWRMAADRHAGEPAPPHDARPRSGQTMSNRTTAVRRRGTRRPQASASIGQPNRSQGMSYIDGFVIAVP